VQAQIHSVPVTESVRQLVTDWIAWAGAVMLRDLAPKVGRPGVWLQSRHLDAVRRWTEAWKRRARCPP